jgi:hypothetical protein
MRLVTWFRAIVIASLVTLGAAASSCIGHAQTVSHELIIVPPKKMPAETRQPGTAMTLHLVGSQTLYLYVEEQNAQKLAIYDVSDPGKIKLKKIVQVEVPGPYDFVQSANSSLELIRYRNGGQAAMLDLSKPVEPRLRAIGSSASESYVVPLYRASSSPVSPKTGVDYEVFVQSSAQPLLTIRGVVQEETDGGNGTIYLLGGDGLTEIRNVKVERRLAASAPAWTNTIDDN